MLLSVLRTNHLQVFASFVQIPKSPLLFLKMMRVEEVVLLVTVVVDIAVADAVEAEAEAQKAKVTVRGAETAPRQMKRHEPSFHLHLSPPLL